MTLSFVRRPAKSENIFRKKTESLRPEHAEIREDPPHAQTIPSGTTEDIVSIQRSLLSTLPGLMSQAFAWDIESCWFAMSLKNSAQTCSIGEHTKWKFRVRSISIILPGFLSSASVSLCVHFPSLPSVGTSSSKTIRRKSIQLGTNVFLVGCSPSSSFSRFSENLRDARESSMCGVVLVHSVHQN